MGKPDYNMIFAGFGGQGILFLAKAVAYAGLMEGYEVSWLPSYGPEMRGGTANCSVCLSGEPISSPLVTVPDILIAMNLPSWRKFKAALRPGAVALLDSSLIPAEEWSAGDDLPEDARIFPVPATTLAENQNLPGLANMVMLGALHEISGFCSREALEQGLANCVPPKKSGLLESNLRALSLARDLVRTAKGSSDFISVGI